MTDPRASGNDLRTDPAIGDELPETFDADPVRPSAGRKSPLPWLMLFLLIVAGVGGYYFWRQMKPAPLPPLPSVPAAQTEPSPQAGAEPAIRHPIEEAQSAPETGKDAAPLPALAESDPTMQDALTALFGPATLDKVFYRDDIVHRFVTTIDNLPRKTVAARLMPVKPIAGPLVVTNKDGGLAIGADNAARYTAYVRMAEAIDTKKLTAVYIRYYPLLQQAYRDLGYPKGYFNDRLVEVIDDLLAAPELQAPIQLVQPKVLYQFADPELEARSAGQKIMLRMGNENAARVKAKLREIRRGITGPNSKP